MSDGVSRPPQSLPFPVTMINISPTRSGKPYVERDDSPPLYLYHFLEKDREACSPSFVAGLT
jgi:hypothetical protein